MISWKDSYEKISKDLEQARKKKQALDDLFNTEKISALTYESLDNELTKTIFEIEARQKDLANKMASKISDLEKQVGTLELFLANSEIQYAAGEIDEESHTSETGAFTLGLNVVKQELTALKNVVAELMPEVAAPPPLQTTSEEVPTTVEVAETSEISVETPLEIQVEETTDVEFVTDEAKAEEGMETSTEEMPSEEIAEVPVSEEIAEVPVSEEIAEVPVSEEIAEVPVSEEIAEVPVSEEIAEVPVSEETTETLPEPPGEEVLKEEELVVNEEAVVEEETEASTEEASSYEEETEASTEEASSYEEEEATIEEEAY